MGHHLENNPDEWEHDNPFVPATTPSQLSKVECEPPACPFQPEQVQWLNTELSRRVDIYSRNMQVRRLHWQEALQISYTLIDMD